MAAEAPPRELQVLLVEDDPGDALLVQEMLSGARTASFRVSCVDRVNTAGELLQRSRFDVILLDLSLPDAQGLDAVGAIRGAAPETPIIVMSGLDDVDIAVQIVQQGIQDYLVKGHADSDLLVRAIRYAIERKHTEEELRRRNAELSLLYRVSTAVSQITDMNSLFAEILETVTTSAMLNLDGRGIAFIADNGMPRLASQWGQGFEPAGADRMTRFGESLLKTAAEASDVIVSIPASGEERSATPFADLFPNGHAIVPLLVRGKLVGVMSLALRKGMVIDGSGARLLLSIGEHVGVTVENARLYEETKAMSLRDPLTGLANRRYMDIVFESSLARTRRYGAPLSVVMLDIDHFKQYNDNHGHLAGDKILVDIARLIMDEVRDADLAVRYGGEEFLILLSDTETAKACEAAERLRRTISEKTDVTVSLGVASYDHGTQTKERLIERTDSALYRAKEEGRNRTVCYDDL